MRWSTSPVPTDPIKITGLRELQKALKDIDGESQKALRGVLNDAAALVVSRAKANAPARTGALQQSIRVSSSQREARVSGGSAKVPYFGAVEYGGHVGRNRATVLPRHAQGRT